MLKKNGKHFRLVRRMVKVHLQSEYVYKMKQTSGAIPSYNMLTAFCFGLGSYLDSLDVRES